MPRSGDSRPEADGPSNAELASTFRDQLPWDQIHVFWGDERYVPHDHPHSNYRMAKDTLLDHVPCPVANIHPMPTHFDDADAAARDYEAQTGTHVSIAEFPYANLFEKELIDLNALTGAYDLIMLDDPWFPKFASWNVLTDLTPLLQTRGKTGPDEDFVATSMALCREPYQTGGLYALPYVGNPQLFFYRKDLFQKHNLKEPATWDDVLGAAKSISENETTGAPGGGKVYGYVMRAAQGNAAVADFMVPLALGTQTGGSVLRPASFCGIVGYKPTFNLVNRAGVKPLAWSESMLRSTAPGAAAPSSLQPGPAWRSGRSPRRPTPRTSSLATSSAREATRRSSRTTLRPITAVS